MTAQSGTAMQPVRGTVPIRQTTGETLEQFEKLNDTIARRAFELFQGNGRWLGHELDDWLRAESELLHPVHMDVTESDGEFSVRAEVPGFGVKDLEIKVEPRSLRIMGKREMKDEKNGRKISSDWCADQILRSIDLPVDVDPAKANAVLKDGILTVELPKSPHARAIRVEPKLA